MLSKRLIKSNDAAGGVCLSDETDIFGDGSGVALYQLNWDGSDMSGNYDLTDYAGGAYPIFTTGKIDSALAMLSTSDTAYIANLNMPNHNSESFWIKVNQFDDDDDVCFSYYIRRQGFTVPLVQLSIPVSNGGVLLDSADNLPIGEWTHVVLSINGTTLSVYYNGQLQNTKTIPNGSLLNGLGIIADDQLTTTRFEIDQVRIFNKALSTGEVTTLYNEVACEKTCTTDDNQLVSDCIAYYKLDGNAEDALLTYDGTPTNVSWTQGRFGSAAGFNGSSSVISLTQPVDLSNEGFAYSFWIKGNTNSTYGGLISQYGTSTATRNIYSYRNANGTIIFGLISTNGTFNSLTSIGTNPLSVWTHIVLVKDATTQYIYLDGVLDNSIANSLTTSTSSEPLLIGDTNDTVTNEYFNGSIDQVRIYDRAITAAEVTTLYNEVACPSGASFNTVLYTGTGAIQNVGGVGFQPDLVWIKDRGNTESHQLLDSIRGAGKVIESDDALGEVTRSNGLTSFDSNGFTLGADGAGFVNYVGRGPYVAWCWKAGGDAVTNTDGTITSEVSANVDAGFSIAKFTCNGTTTSVGHGLNQKPDIIFTKNLSASESWFVQQYIYAPSGNAAYGFLNTTAAFTGFTDNITDNSVMQQGGTNGQDYIAYCFHSVAGFSKFGSYIGTGASGHKQTMDFEPAFLLTKKSSGAGSWHIHDNKRNTSNPRLARLYPDSSDAETSPSYGMNFYSDGFDFTSGAYNDSGDTYIYMAFANQF